MASSTTDTTQVDIPPGAEVLEAFRRWVTSPAFPESGRIDFLAGEVWVDVSPEDLYTHGTLKAEIAAVLHELIGRTGRGCVFVDRARVTVPDAELSVEPDVMAILWSTLDGGRAQEVPAASGTPGRFREIEGPPDLIVEVVSDGSVEKDLERLPELYGRAGVPELWIVDARGEEVELDRRLLEASGYRSAPEKDGWRCSPLLDREVRLHRQPVGRGRSTYLLETRPEPSVSGD